MTFPRTSSKYGTDHPPYLKPPLSSSPGPPGACITPSSVMNDKTMSFLILPRTSFVSCSPDYGTVENSSVPDSSADDVYALLTAVPSSWFGKHGSGFGRCPE